MNYEELENTATIPIVSTHVFFVTKMALLSVVDSMVYIPYGVYPSSLLQKPHLQNVPGIV